MPNAATKSKAGQKIDPKGIYIVGNKLGGYAVTGKQYSQYQKDRKTLTRSQRARVGARKAGWYGTFGYNGLTAANAHRSAYNATTKYGAKNRAKAAKHSGGGHGRQRRDSHGRFA